VADPDQSKPDDSSSPSGLPDESESLATSLEQGTEGDLPHTGMRTDQGRLARWFTIRDEPGGIERFLFGIACILLVLLIWHILTRGEGEARIVDPYTLPSLQKAFGSFHELWFDRALMRGAIASLTRVLAGFLLAAAIAIPVGVVAGCFPRFHAFLRPLSIFGRNTPIAALIPLTLIWFGLGEVQKVMFIFLAAVAFIFFDTTMSVRSVPGNYLDTAYTLGARSSWKNGLRRALYFGLAYALLAAFGLHWLTEAPQTIIAEAVDGTIPAQPGFLTQSAFWIHALLGLLVGTLLWLPVQSHQAICKVLFPLALPNIVNSLRLLFGLAFGYIMLAEVINAEFGLGKIIIMSQRIGPREHIYLCLMVIALIAFAIDRLILIIQRRAFPYVSHGH